MLLPVLCGPLQEAKNVLEIPLQIQPLKWCVLVRKEHFKVRNFATCVGTCRQRTTHQDVSGLYNATGSVADVGSVVGATWGLVAMEGPGAAKLPVKSLVRFGGHKKNFRPNLVQTLATQHVPKQADIGGHHMD